MYNHAKKMRELRNKRRKESLCTRCGDKIKKEEFNICQSCRDYLKKYNNENRDKYKKDKKIIRNTKTWEVKNWRLYDALIDKKISIPELAEKVGVSTRSADNWIFFDSTPKADNRKKINQVLEKNIYFID